MSLTSVFRRDLRKVRRNWLFFTVVLVTAFLFAMYTVLRTKHSINEEYLIQDFIFFMSLIVALSLPVLATLAASYAISGERSSHSLKYVLATPITRNEFLIGTFLSRVVVSVSSLLALFAVVVLLLLVRVQMFAYQLLGVVCLLSVLSALAYTAITLAFSTLTASPFRTISGLVLFHIFTTVPGILTFGVTVPRQFENLVYFVVGAISPAVLYVISVVSMFPDTGFENRPWFVQGEMAIFGLVVWTVGPLLLALWGFNRADIGQRRS